ncbi:unnamed protein product [Taenia asiatica]|uniref:Craniofacial development protein 1 n=1 Tax=Taenia asiatica TaxID=60517 RepID=A0A0R3WEU9_TAEAS|nr:unnamed protein product [Taenia asiatica]
MGDSTKSESESSDDEEYIPPAVCEEESSDDSEDEVSDDEVGGGTSVKKGTKPLEEKDRDEIWTDFLKETRPVVITRISAHDFFYQGSTGAALVFFFPWCCTQFSQYIEGKSYWTGIEVGSIRVGESRLTTFRRSAPSTGNRLADALKRLKSSTLSSGVPKISVLEKSRLDWESFTEKEGIKDDLKLHNKGKNGWVNPFCFMRLCLTLGNFGCL